MSCSRTICRKRRAPPRCHLIALTFPREFVTKWFCTKAPWKIRLPPQFPRRPPCLTTLPPRLPDENSFADILSEFEQQHSRRADQTTKRWKARWFPFRPNRCSWTSDERWRECCRWRCFATRPASLTVKPGDKLRVTVTGRDRKARTRFRRSKWSGPRTGARWNAPSPNSGHRRRGDGTGEGRPARGCGIAAPSCPLRAAAPRIRPSSRSWWARKSSAASSSSIRPAKMWWWIAAWCWKKKRRKSREKKFAELQEGRGGARNRAQLDRFRRVRRSGRRGRTAARGRHGLASRGETLRHRIARAIPSKSRFSRSPRKAGAFRWA